MQIKLLTKLLTATSIIALTAGSAANASTSGSITAGISFGQETTGMHSHFWMKSLGGQIEFGLGDGWSSQVELFASESGANANSWFGKYGDQTGLSTYGATAHVNTDIADNLKLGGFAMLEETTVGDQGYVDEGAGSNLYGAFGGEIRWAASSAFSLTGQVGGLFHLENPGINADDCNSLCNAFFARVGAAWFFDPNDVVTAGAGYLGGNGGKDWVGHTVGQTGWNWGVTVRHQFEDSPFAVYVGYNGMRFAWDGYSQTDNVIGAGVTYFFNGDTLETQHNSGGFSTPHFERQINLSISQDDAGFPFGPSDMRLKRDIRLLATLASGMKIYSFKYLWSDIIYVGVMAQDLMANPAWRNAVVTMSNGYYAVNYDALGLQMTTFDHWRAKGLSAIQSGTSLHQSVPKAA